MDMTPSTTNTDAAAGRGKGSTMDTTHSYVCPCGDCGGEHIAVTFTGGFAGTTCEVAACGYWQARGMVSFTVRRSDPLAWTPAVAEPVAHYAHPDALVAVG